jgi:hypothetical protein
VNRKFEKKTARRMKRKTGEGKEESLTRIMDD